MTDPRPTIPIARYTDRLDVVRAAMGCLLRGRASQRAFFASLEQRVEDATAGLIRALESAHGTDDFQAALDDASVDVALVVDAAREMERNLASWAVMVSAGLNDVDASEEAGDSE